MKTVGYAIAGFSVLVIALSGCGRQSLGVAKLYTGEEVQVIQMENRYFTSGEKAFYLSYKTEEPFNEIDELNAEEEKVWERFKSEADRREMTAAIISPTKIKQVGLFSKSYCYNYIYRKINGSWVLTNKPDDGISK